MSNDNLLLFEISVPAGFSSWAAKDDWMAAGRDRITPVVIVFVKREMEG
jgi:hypothetical protein